MINIINKKIKFLLNIKNYNNNLSRKNIRLIWNLIKYIPLFLILKNVKIVLLHIHLNI
jgi:hypothetical protein